MSAQFRAFSTVNDTATQDVDFVYRDTTVNLFASVTTTVVRLFVIQDGQFELPDESFTIMLYDAGGGATFASGQDTEVAPVTILDDGDSTLAFTASSLLVSEAVGGLTVTVTRYRDPEASAGKGAQVRFSLASSGTATRGTECDFEDATCLASTVTDVIYDEAQTLSLSADDEVKTVVLTICNDIAYEANEFFVVQLQDTEESSSASGYQAQPAMTVTLQDDGDAGTVHFTQAAYRSTANPDGSSSSTATVSITRTGGISCDVTAVFATEDAVAKTSDNDYNPASETVFFEGWTQSDGHSAEKNAQNATVVTFVSPVPDEFFIVHLSSVQGGAELLESSDAYPSRAPLTIHDNAPAYDFEVVSLQHPEGLPRLQVAVVLSGDRLEGFDLHVDVATENGTAMPELDFATLPPTRLNFTATSKRQLVNVTVLDDDIFEGFAGEKFYVQLSNPSADTKIEGRGRLTVTIAEDDDTTLAFDPASFAVLENAGSATFTVSRFGTTERKVYATVGVTGGTAESGEDFQAFPDEQLTFDQGAAAVTVSIEVNDDDVYQILDSTLVLGITAPVNTSLGGPFSQPTATLTIRDDGDAGTVAFASATYSAEEGDGWMTMTLTREGGESGVLSATIEYDTSVYGEAESGVDFFFSGGSSVALRDAADSATVSVQIFDDDALEGTERIQFVISDLTGGGRLGSQVTADLLINDNDDMEIQFSTGTYEFTEADATYTLTVLREGYNAQDVEVTITPSTSPGMDAGKVDGYEQTLASALTIPSGDDKVTFSITVHNDDVFQDPDDYLVFTLSDPVKDSKLRTGFLGATTVATAFIRDDGDAGEVYFTTPSVDVFEHESQVTVTVTRTGPPSVSAQIRVGADTDLSTATSSASKLADYDALPFSERYFYQAGELVITTATVRLGILDDGIFEAPNEFVSLALRDPRGGVLVGTPSLCNVTIMDDGKDTSIEFHTNAITVPEDHPEPLTVTITRTGSDRQPVSFSVSYSSPRDNEVYIAASAPTSVSLGTGVSSQTFTIDLVNDEVYNQDRIVTFSFTDLVSDAIEIERQPAVGALDAFGNRITGLGAGAAGSTSVYLDKNGNSNGKLLQAAAACAVWDGTGSAPASDCSASYSGQDDEYAFSSLIQGSRGERRPFKLHFAHPTYGLATSNSMFMAEIYHKRLSLQSQPSQPAYWADDAIGPFDLKLVDIDGADFYPPGSVQEDLIDVFLIGHDAANNNIFFRWNETNPQAVPIDVAAHTVTMHGGAATAQAFGVKQPLQRFRLRFQLRSNNYYVDSALFKMSHGAPAALEWSSQPLGNLTRTYFPTQPALTVRDQFGNLVERWGNLTVTATAVNATMPSLSLNLGGVTTVDVLRGTAAFAFLHVLDPGDYELRFAVDQIPSLGYLATNLSFAASPVSALRHEVYTVSFQCQATQGAVDVEAAAVGSVTGFSSSAPAVELQHRLSQELGPINVTSVAYSGAEDRLCEGDAPNTVTLVFEAVPEEDPETVHHKLLISTPAANPLDNLNYDGAVRTIRCTTVGTAGRVYLTLPTTDGNATLGPIATGISATDLEAAIEADPTLSGAGYSDVSISYAGGSGLCTEGSTGSTGPLVTISMDSYSEPPEPFSTAASIYTVRGESVTQPHEFEFSCDQLGGPENSDGIKRWRMFSGWGVPLNSAVEDDIYTPATWRLAPCDIEVGAQGNGHGNTHFVLHTPGLQWVIQIPAEDEFGLSIILVVGADEKMSQADYQTKLDDSIQAHLLRLARLRTGTEAPTDADVMGLPEGQTWYHTDVAVGTADKRLCDDSDPLVDLDIKFRGHMDVPPTVAPRIGPRALWQSTNITFQIDEVDEIVAGKECRLGFSAATKTAMAYEWMACEQLTRQVLAFELATELGSPEAFSSATFTGIAPDESLADAGGASVEVTLDATTLHNHTHLAAVFYPGTLAYDVMDDEEKMPPSGIVPVFQSRGENIANFQLSPDKLDEGPESTETLNCTVQSVSFSGTLTGGTSDKDLISVQYYDDPQDTWVDLYSGSVQMDQDVDPLFTDIAVNWPGSDEVKLRAVKESGGGNGGAVVDVATKYVCIEEHTVTCNAEAQYDKFESNAEDMVNDGGIESTEHVAFESKLTGFMTEVDPLANIDDGLVSAFGINSTFTSLSGTRKCSSSTTRTVGLALDPSLDDRPLFSDPDVATFNANNVLELTSPAFLLMSEESKVEGGAYTWTREWKSITTTLVQQGSVDLFNKHTWEDGLQSVEVAEDSTFSFKPVVLSSSAAPVYSPRVYSVAFTYCYVALIECRASPLPATSVSKAAGTTLGDDGPEIHLLDEGGNLIDEGPASVAQLAVSARSGTDLLYTSIGSIEASGGVASVASLSFRELASSVRLKAELVWTANSGRLSALTNSSWDLSLEHGPAASLFVVKEPGPGLVSAPLTRGTTSSIKITVQDDGDAGTVRFASGPDVVSENEGSVLTLTLTRENGASGSSLVFFDVTAGRAELGIDFQFEPESQAVVLGDGTTVAYIEVHVLDDDLFEWPDESATVTLTGTVGGARMGDQNTAGFTIEDNGDAGRLGFDSTQNGVMEGNGDAVELQVPVYRAGGDSGVITCDFTTADALTSAGDAVATVGNDCADEGVDFLTTSGTLTFADRQSVQPVPVKVCDDFEFEFPEEALLLKLSNVRYQGSVIPQVVFGENTTQTITILDDGDAGQIAFQAAGQNVEESGGGASETFSIEVERVGRESSTELVVKYTVVENAAEYDFDSDPLYNNGYVEADQDNPSWEQVVVGSADDRTDVLVVVEDTDLFVFPFPITAVRIHMVYFQTSEGNLYPLPGSVGGQSRYEITIKDDGDAGTFAFTEATYSFGENSTNAAVTVTRTGTRVSGDISVFFSSEGGTATEGEDYTDPLRGDGDALFADGKRTQVFEVTINNDQLFEYPDEYFTLRILTLKYAGEEVDTLRIGGAREANITILDDGDAGTMAFAQVEFGVIEGLPEPQSITVTRLGAASGNVTVRYTSACGSAVASYDYVKTEGTLSFGDEQETAVFTVEVLDDDLFEFPSEFYSVSIQDYRYLGMDIPELVIGRRDTANIVIGDDGDAGTLGFFPAVYEVPETTGQDTLVTLTVTRLSGSSGQISVRVDTANGTAITPDGLCDGLDSSQLVTARAPPVGPSASYDVSEICAEDYAGAPQQFTSQRILADYATMSGAIVGTNTSTDTVQTAACYVDDQLLPADRDFYQISNAFLTFENGQTVGTIVVRVSDDRSFEYPTESFAVTLSDVRYGEATTAIPIQPFPSAEVRILDNGDAGTFSLVQRPYNGEEGDGALVTLTVTREGSTSKQITVRYSLNDDTAVFDNSPRVLTQNSTVNFTVNGTVTQVVNTTTTTLPPLPSDMDYHPGQFSVTFGEGEATQEIVAELRDDDLLELPDEVFGVVLDEVVYSSADAEELSLGLYTMEDGRFSSVTITDDGDGGTFQFAPVSHEFYEVNGSHALQYTLSVTRLGGTSRRVTIDYASVNGTALSSEDFLATAGTLTFEDGVHVQSLNVTVLDDPLFEFPDENFTVQLTTIRSLGLEDYYSLRINESARVATVLIRDDGDAGTISLVGTSFQGKEGDEPHDASAPSDYTLVHVTLTRTGRARPSGRLSIALMSEGVSAADGCAIDLSRDDNRAVTNLRDSPSDDATPPTSGPPSSILPPGPQTVEYGNISGGCVGGLSTTEDFRSLDSSFVLMGDGESWTTFAVALTNDGVFEYPDETLTLNITGVLYLGQDVYSTHLQEPLHAAITVLDDGDAGSFLWEVANELVSEGAGAQAMTVSRVGRKSQTMRVSYSTSEVSAAAGRDFEKAEGFVDFADGVTTRVIDIGITNDSEFEVPDEFFFVNITQVRYVDATDEPLEVSTVLAAEPAVSTITILDDGDSGTLMFVSKPYPIAEERAGSSDVVLTVTRVDGDSGALVLRYTTLDGNGVTHSATPDLDFSSTTGLLFFRNQEENKTFTVTIIDDVEYEHPDEMLEVELSDVRYVIFSPETDNYTTTVSPYLKIGSASKATVTVLDNGDAGTVQFHVANYSAPEMYGQDTLLNVTVTRLSERSKAVRAYLSFEAGTAAAEACSPTGEASFAGTGRADAGVRPATASDYVGVDLSSACGDPSGGGDFADVGDLRVLLGDGQTIATLSVRILDDNEFEFPDETFFLNLVRLVYVDDTGTERSTNDTGYSLGLGAVTQSTITIEDDGDAGTLSFQTDVQYNVDENESSATLTVLRTTLTGGAGITAGSMLLVDYSTAGILASSTDQCPALDSGVCTDTPEDVGEADFVPTTGTLTFGPADASAIIVVQVCDDVAFEYPDETLQLQLEDFRYVPVVGGAVRGLPTLRISPDDTATVTIKDDGDAGTIQFFVSGESSPPSSYRFLERKPKSSQSWSQVTLTRTGGRCSGELTVQAITRVTESGEIGSIVVPGASEPVDLKAATATLDFELRNITVVVGDRVAETTVPSSDSNGEIPDDNSIINDDTFSVDRTGIKEDDFEVFHIYLDDVRYKGQNLYSTHLNQAASTIPVIIEDDGDSGTVGFCSADEDKDSGLPCEEELWCAGVDTCAETIKICGDTLALPCSKLPGVVNEKYLEVGEEEGRLRVDVMRKSLSGKCDEDVEIRYYTEDFSTDGTFQAVEKAQDNRLVFERDRKDQVNTFFVTVIDDLIVTDDKVFVLYLEDPSVDDGAAAQSKVRFFPSQAAIGVYIRDDDTPEIIFCRVASGCYDNALKKYDDQNLLEYQLDGVVEGSQEPQAMYMVLKTNPGASSVSVVLVANSDLELAKSPHGTTSSTVSITFQSSDFNIPQGVFVRAVDDNVDRLSEYTSGVAISILSDNPEYSSSSDSPITIKMSSSGTSGSADVCSNSFTGACVAVTVEDNDGGFQASLTLDNEEGNLSPSDYEDIDDLKRQTRQEVASALGISVNRVRIVGVREGSIILNLRILIGQNSGGGIGNAMEAAASRLHRQIWDPLSPLRQGEHLGPLLQPQRSSVLLPGEVGDDRLAGPRTTVSGPVVEAIHGGPPQNVHPFVRNTSASWEEASLRLPPGAQLSGWPVPGFDTAGPASAVSFVREPGHRLDFSSPASPG